jgi:hypothetical protein
VKQINVIALQFKFLDSMKIHFVFGVSLMLEPYHVFTILNSRLETKFDFNQKNQENMTFKKIGLLKT